MNCTCKNEGVEYHFGFTFFHMYTVEAASYFAEPQHYTVFTCIYMYLAMFGAVQMHFLQ